MRAVRQNIKPRPCCIDRAIARSIQQDRGLIFYRAARTVKVSKFFFIIWHMMRFEITATDIYSFHYIWSHGNIISQVCFQKINLSVKYNYKIKFSIMMNKNSKKSIKVIVLTGLKIRIKHVQKRNVISIYIYIYIYQRLFDKFDQIF